MAAAKSQSVYARLEIGPPAHRRVVQFSRAQFEILLLLLPAVFIWGVGSTILLMSLIWNPDQETSKMAEVGSGVVQTAPVNEISQSQMDSLTVNAQTEVPSKPPAPVIQYGGANFTVGQIFAVKALVTATSDKGPLSVVYTLKNLGAEHERGHLWVRVRGTNKAGAEVNYLSSPGIEFTEDGHALNPERGVRYSVRGYLSKSILLYGDQSEISDLASIEFGFDRGTAGQSVAIETLKKDGKNP
jgi:hypothetical protein